MRFLLLLFLARPACASPDPEAPAALAVGATAELQLSSAAVPAGQEPAGAAREESRATVSAATAAKTSEIAVSTAVFFPSGYKPVRALHFSAWAAGSTRARRKFLDQLQGTVVNGMVIPVKEIDGFVYIPGVAKAREYGTQKLAMPYPEETLRDLKARGLTVIARVAVFKDDALARNRPAWAVHEPDGALWVNDKGVAWVDPYRKEVWEYNLDVASRAAAWGFDEVQFDYIRFPSDGDTAQCRYSRADDSPSLAARTLREFLVYARERLAPFKVPVSAAIFGMTTTAKDDMGIGQRIAKMTELLDFVSPMMYPSHYARGEYGLKEPNREPYKVVNRGLRDAKVRLGASSYKLRPYLQDFSLGFHYGAPEVLAEIRAAKAQGFDSWILWNPGNHYTWSALRPDDQPAGNRP